MIPAVVKWCVCWLTLISNSGKIRIAPFERCIGLGVDPSGPAELNRLRKRMMTWLWASFTSSWVCERFSN